MTTAVQARLEQRRERKAWPTIADSHAFDLARCIIRRDENTNTIHSAYLDAEVDAAFRQVALDLGYVVATQREVTAARVREMNAELPEADREVMELKGMI